MTSAVPWVRGIRLAPAPRKRGSTDGQLLSPLSVRHARTRLVRFSALA